MQLRHSELYSPRGSILKLLHYPSTGPKPEHSHMERKEGDMNPKGVLPVPDGSVETNEDDMPAAEHLDACDAVLKWLQTECLSALQDGRNIGSYINETTTKIDPLGDEPLQGLRIVF